MTHKNIRAESVKLVTPNEFKNAVKKVLSNSKRESDKQMADFQASDVRKREERKQRWLLGSCGTRSRRML